MPSIRSALRAICLSLFLAWSAQAQLAEPIEESPKLQIRTISVLGNSLLPEETVESIINPYRERDLSLPEMKELAQTLEQRYRDEGYLLVRVIIPSQKPDGGLLLLQVVESEIDDVEVEGNSRYSQEFLKSRFTDNLSSSVYRSQDVEGSLLLLNDLPDLKVRALLRQGEEPGTSRLVLVADEDKNYHFNLSYNNFGTRLTGEHRFGLGGDFSSVLTQGDILAVGGVLATPARDTLFWSANYSFPVGTAGTRLGLAHSEGNYSVGQELEALNIQGDASVSALSLSHPLKRSFSHSADIGMQLSYNDVLNRALRRVLSEDQYTAVQLDYTNQWQDPNGRTVLRMGVKKGLGGTRRGDPRASRLNAGGDFTKFQLDAARLQRMNDSFSMLFRGSAQFTGDSLFSVEQMPVGGPDTVRGFLPAETLGDQGYALSAELRWSPLVNNRDLFQTVFFVDHGGITQTLPPPGLRGSRQLTGAGLGFRVNYEQTRVRLDLGFPISPDINSQNRSPVIYGQVTTRF